MQPSPPPPLTSPQGAVLHAEIVSSRVPDGRRRRRAVPPRRRPDRLGQRALSLQEAIVDAEPVEARCMQALTAHTHHA